MESQQLLIVSYLLLINLSIFQVLLAADTINSLQPLKDGEKLVSSQQTFELGFFSPRNSKNRYLGMWYVKVPGTVVWVANRNNPITDSSGVLTISNDGNLVILSQSKSIWSSNASVVAEHPVAQLLDSGNLVLRNNGSTNSESYLWQSFDYPSDTLLAGMKLGWNLRTRLQRYLTAWRTDEDPSPGNFTYKLDISPLPQIITRQGLTKFARIGPWNGAFFIGLPKIPYTVIKSTTIFYEDEIAYTYETVSKSVITLLTLNQSGILQRLVWNDTTGWRSINLGPSDQCDKYGKCGANGKCNTSNVIVCECLKGYVPKSDKEWGAHNWTSGCVRRKPLDCQKPPVFFKLENVKLPDLLEFQVNNSMNPAACQAECSKNCSCAAYAYSNPSEGGVGCFMWFGNLVDTNSLTDEFRVQDLYIRVSASDIEVPSNSSKKRRLKYVIVISIATTLGISLMILLFCISWKKRQKRGINRNTEEMEGIESNSEEMEVPLFDFHTISTATNNFSLTNVIGEGGFGPVYKGMLLTGQEIAVKRLSSYSRQGVDEFKNEVILIAKLQHRNLVGLLGCCTKGEEKMLIYEYLPNRSLDHFIFDDHKSCLLSWKKRYDIVLGIARGLLYLHQDSKLQIVHRDLKASNILLDSNLNPKISDFGLARILGDDEHEAKTKRVAGTYGYMSPEYAVDGKFSTKSDVFSLGVLLLEIVSGKRNRGFKCPDHHHNLVGHAWLRWNQGRALELMDTVFGDTCIESQVQRCIHVGLLCVQKLPQDRPTMSSVVFMLEIEGAVLPQPKEPGFFTERGWATSSSSSEMYTGNSLTISTMDAR